jgi:hypothetical protein
MEIQQIWFVVIMSSKPMPIKSFGTSCRNKSLIILQEAEQEEMRKFLSN